MNSVYKPLDRTTYRRIKSYTKEEMSGFCNKLYMNGRKEAFEEIDLEQMRSDIAAIKGIGEVKLAQIMEIVAKTFEISDTD